MRRCHSLKVRYILWQARQIGARRLVYFANCAHTQQHNCYCEVSVFVEKKDHRETAVFRLRRWFRNILKNWPYHGVGEIPQKFLYPYPDPDRFRNRTVWLLVVHRRPSINFARIGRQLIEISGKIRLIVHIPQWRKFVQEFSEPDPDDFQNLTAILVQRFVSRTIFTKIGSLVLREVADRRKV